MQVLEQDKNMQVFLMIRQKYASIRAGQKHASIGEVVVIELIVNPKHSRTLVLFAKLKLKP